MLNKSFLLLKNCQEPLLKRNFHLANNVHSIKANSGGILDNFFGTRVEKATNAHSVLLADQQILYELQIDQVKPQYATDYEKYCNDYVPNMLNKNSFLKLAGSWKSEIGVMDTYVNLWQHKNYTEYSDSFEKLKKDNQHQEFRNKIAKFINKRESQVCLSFTFWGMPTPRTDSHIYEMRSYALKPGTLIEWGNNWSRGIRNRLDYRVAGMFTQVGPIYYVHHIWAYKSLHHRKESREKMWSKPGWDECVAYTVPLIRKMESKIMTPLPFSPTK